MVTILILGAGKSSTVLIDYLLKDAEKKSRQVFLADASLELAEKKIKDHPHASAFQLDVQNREQKEALMDKADVVVSMLPPFLHDVIAKECLRKGKHFFSASYVTDEMKKMEPEIRAKSLFFLNECGLDPGLDHMYAMRIIDQTKAEDKKITLFKSFCGGLLAPESEDNPWQYKFTWNPRGVVLSGTGVSSYIKNGYYQFVPYHMLFKRTEEVFFSGLGEFEGIPNGDSLPYREFYGLEDVPTFIRSTIRKKGFCKSWDVFVQLGLTDNSFQVDLPDNYSKRMFVDSFLPFSQHKEVEEKIVELLPWVNDEILTKLKWTGLLSDQKLDKRQGSPADILQHILEEKWKLQAEDKDMVLMQHQFEIKSGKGKTRITSKLVVKGETQDYTAMAKTVGLPLGIAVDLFLEGKFQSRGLLLPTINEIYEPILNRLEEEGLLFEEHSINI